MQKLVYFESVHTSVEAKYYGHYYGPFSECVAEGIARLWEWGYVHEDVPTHNYPGYTYSLTRDGDRLGTKVVSKRGQDGYAKIRFVVQICRKSCGLQQSDLSYAAKVHYDLGLCSHSPRQEQSDLSYAAKVHYMKEHNKRPGAGVGELVDMGRRAGWKMTADNVSSGVSLLGELGLGT